MARLVYTEKDRKFADGVRQELDNNIIQQKVLYYGIDMQKSSVDEVYGEITKKIYYNPIAFFCRILWEEPEVVYVGGTEDTIYRIECYVNTKELENRSIVAKSGDIIENNSDFYEIEKVILTKPEMGQHDSKIETKLVCRSCRMDFFDAPVHPIEAPRDNYSGTMNPDIPTSESYGTKELVFPD